MGVLIPRKTVFILKMGVGIIVCSAAGIFARASIHQAHGRLTARSREVSKPRDSGLDRSNSSKIWQAFRQPRCRNACQNSERYDHCNIQSHGFETSRDLAVRGLPCFILQPTWSSLTFNGFRIIIYHNQRIVTFCEAGCVFQLLSICYRQW